MKSARAQIVYGFVTSGFCLLLANCGKFEATKSKTQVPAVQQKQAKDQNGNAVLSPEEYKKSEAKSASTVELVKSLDLSKSDNVDVAISTLRETVTSQDLAPEHKKEILAALGEAGVDKHFDALQIRDLFVLGLNNRLAADKAGAKVSAAVAKGAQVAVDSLAASTKDGKFSALEFQTAILAGANEAIVTLSNDVKNANDGDLKDLKLNVAENEVFYKLVQGALMKALTKVESLKDIRTDEQKGKVVERAQATITDDLKDILKFATKSMKRADAKKVRSLLLTSSYKSPAVVAEVQKIADERSTEAYEKFRDAEREELIVAQLREQLTEALKAKGLELVQDSVKVDTYPTLSLGQTLKESLLAISMPGIGPILALNNKTMKKLDMAKVQSSAIANWWRDKESRIAMVYFAASGEGRLKKGYVFARTAELDAGSAAANEALSELTKQYQLEKGQLYNIAISNVGAVPKSLGEINLHLEDLEHE